LDGRKAVGMTPEISAEQIEQLLSELEEFNSHLPTRRELAERALRDLNSWCGDIETSTLTVADVQKVVRSVVAAYFDNVNLGIYAGGRYDDEPSVRPNRARRMAEARRVSALPRRDSRRGRTALR
jgi:hypothetical protein